MGSRLLRILAAQIASSAILIGSSGALAAVLHVPGDHGTIGAAISAAQEGDTILIASGVYSGPGNRDLDFGGKNLIVRSEHGAAVTEIDCGGTATTPHRGFTLHSGETNASVIEGLTIRNGYVRMPGGAGILCDGASPIVRDCVLQQNSVEYFGEDGGGILLRNSQARVEGCTFRWNYASYGGGLACRGASHVRIERCDLLENAASYGAGMDAGGIGEVEILGCKFQGNESIGGFEDAGSGGGLLLGGTVVVEGCTITGNSSGFGAGVAVWSGTASIRECTIAGNNAGLDRGGALAAFASTTTLDRCVLWGNCAASGRTLAAGSGGTIRFGCCVIESGHLSDGGQVEDLGGNLELDPQFCGPSSCDSAPTTAGDYRVGRDSVCLPAGNPCGDWIGSQPVGCPTTDAPGISTAATSSPLTLDGPRPNPVREALEFTLVVRERGTCRVEVLDVQGRRVAALHEGSVGPGAQRFTWSPPASIGAGMYFLSVRSLWGRDSRAFLLIR